MSAEFRLGYGELTAFLLVLIRVASAFAFVRLPGSRNLPDAPKIVFSLCLTAALYPVWPDLPAQLPSLGQMLRWLASEAALGITVGLAVAFITEAFVFAGQLIAMQAGFSYASFIDPTTQSDSTVMQSLVQLLAGLLFFVFGLHRDVITIFARSLEAWPPGTFAITEGLAAAIRQLGAAMLTTGVRLALPVLALLMLLDISLALLGRINAQLQLLSLAFPLKMLASLAILAVMISVMPLLFEQAARDSLATLTRLVR